MTKRMLIDALHPEEMRVVIADEKQIFDVDFASASRKQVKGNIYLGKITRVEPSLQAAFVEYGSGKQGFLPFAEIHPDYYQIPVADRKRLMEEAEHDDGPAEAAPESVQPDDEAYPDHLEGYGKIASLPAGEAGEGDAEIAALPMMEAIPEQQFSDSEEIPAESEAIRMREDPTPEETQNPEPRPAQERSLNFATSEVVAAGQVENESLSSQLADAPERQPRSRGERANAEEGVETLANEEEEISSRPKRNFSRRYKIQEVIKRGQVVLIQVIKEERGNKGVSLTTFLSLAGRYCVLMPNSPKDGGISRKISDGDTRKRLKELLTEMKLARGMSAIIRTAGIDRTRAEIRRDFDYLVKLWNRIREVTLASTAPAMIYEESDLIKRAIRDLYTNDIAEVMVEGDEAYKSTREFMKMLLPSHTPRVKQYEGNMPIFYAYGVEDQLLSMHDPVVKLKSGGYIVLNPTEALISIDVNSGRSTGERNIEETATKTNLEAAAEVARQLRLRDLAGLIVIDFIDMMESRNRRNVERALKDALKTDRAKIQLGRISPFGLLEMSRQRLRPSIAEANTVHCPHCAGRGIIRSNESLVIQIVRSLEKEAASGSWHTLRLNVPEHIVLHLLNSKRGLLSQIEERYGVHIVTVIDHDLSASTFNIEKMRKSGNPQRPEGEPERERSDRDRSRGGRGRNRGGRDRDRPETQPVRPEVELAEEIGTADEAAEPSDEAVTPEENQSGDDRRPRRRRGRRGGRGRDRDGRERPPRVIEGDEPVAAGADDTAPSSEPIETEAAAPATEEGARPRRPRRPRSGHERPERGESSPAQSRRRWRGEEEGSRPRTAEPVQAGQPVPQAATGNDYPAAARPQLAPAAGADSLPAFTRSPVLQPPVPPPPAVPQDSTSRPEGQGPRKGWWQRIIELD